MKNLILTAVLTLGFAPIVQAHDEGHGPKPSMGETIKLNNPGANQAPVVAKADEGKVLHRAELVRTGGMAHIYLYDQSGKMKADLSGFDAAADAILWSGAKNSRKKSEFKLQQKDGMFVGTLPKASAPYTIEVNLKKGGQPLIAAFPNIE